MSQSTTWWETNLILNRPKKGVVLDGFGRIGFVLGWKG
jgi:hypothetical protein